MYLSHCYRYDKGSQKHKAQRANTKQHQWRYHKINWSFAKCTTRGYPCGILTSFYCEVTITQLYNGSFDCDVIMKSLSTDAMSGLLRKVNCTSVANRPTTHKLSNWYITKVNLLSFYIIWNITTEKVLCIPPATWPVMLSLYKSFL